MNLARPACWLAASTVLAAALPLSAQVPNLGEGRELWRGQVDGHPMRLIQIPKKASTLVQCRFLLQDLLTNSADTAWFGQFDYAELVALEGIEARRSYAPKRAELHFWGDHLAEVRETFRTPGTYRVRFASSARPDLQVTAVLPVEQYRFLSFGEEFAVFLAGCLALGGLLVAVYRHLRKRIPDRPQLSES